MMALYAHCYVYDSIPYHDDRVYYHDEGNDTIIMIGLYYHDDRRNNI